MPIDRQFSILNDTRNALSPIARVSAASPDQTLPPSSPLALSTSSFPRPIPTALPNRLKLVDSQINSNRPIYRMIFTVTICMIF